MISKHPATLFRIPKLVPPAVLNLRFFFKKYFSTGTRQEPPSDPRTHPELALVTSDATGKARGVAATYEPPADCPGLAAGPQWHCASEASEGDPRPPVTRGQPAGNRRRAQRKQLTQDPGEGAKGAATAVRQPAR